MRALERAEQEAYRACLPPEPPLQERLLSTFRRAFARSRDNEGVTLTLEQRQAREFAALPIDPADGEMLDESFFHVYEKPVFADGQWQARYRGVRPTAYQWEAPYATLLRGFRNMADIGIKPSQTAIALSDLDAIFDSEAAKIDYSHDL